MHYRYDGSFYGLLTVLARIFAWEETPGSITAGAPPQEDLFAEPTTVDTDPPRAAAFLAAVEKKLGFQAARHLLLAHAAELPGSEMALYRYLAFGRKLGRSPDSHRRIPMSSPSTAWSAWSAMRRTGSRASSVSAASPTASGMRRSNRTTRSFPFSPGIFSTAWGRSPG